MILVTRDRGVVPNVSIEQVGEIDALRTAVEWDLSGDAPLAQHLAVSAFLERENPGRVCRPFVLAGSDAEIAIASIHRHPQLFPRVAYPDAA